MTDFKKMRINICNKYLPNKSEATPQRCLAFILRFAEAILAYSAKGTSKILGKVLKFRSGSDSVSRITDCFVIFPATSVTYVLFHCYLLVLSKTESYLSLFL